MALAFVGVADGGKSCHKCCGEHGAVGGECGDSAAIMYAEEYLSPKCKGVDAITEALALAHEVVSGRMADAFIFGGVMACPKAFVGI